MPIALANGLALSFPRGIGGGGAKPYQLTAQKIVEREAAFGGPLVPMTSPPTITVSAAFANSTITDSVMTNADDPIFTNLGTEPVVWPVGYTPSPNLLYAGNIEAGASGRVSGSKTGHTLRVAFYCNADAFEFGVLCSLAPGDGYRIMVDGQPTAVVPRTDVAADSQYRYVKAVFASAALRLIVLEFEKYIAFGGVRIGPTFALTKYDYDPLRLMIVGDSYTDGTGATEFSTGYAMQTGERLGVLDTWINGEGALGYDNAGSLSGKKALEKEAGDVIAYAPDWVVLALGINDGSKVAATINANVTTYLTDLFAALPNVGVTVIGPWRSPDSNPPDAIFDAVRTAVEAMQGYGGRVLYVDTKALAWQDPSSTADYINEGGLYVHPNQTGHDALGQKTAAAVLAHAAAVAA